MRIKKTWKRFFCLLLLAFAVLALPGRYHAATDVPMKKTKVKWDLKPNKTYRVKAKYYSVGRQNMDIRITNFKKKKKGGKVTLTFDVTYDLTVFRPSKSQVHKMIAGMNRVEDDAVGGYYRCIVADYVTGRNLMYEDYDEDTWIYDPEYEYLMYHEDEYEDYEAYVEALRANNTGVDAEERFVKEYGKVTTYDNDGCYVWLTKQVCRYKITYPATYKNLCIGVGGCPELYRSAMEDKFNLGITAFANLRDYKALPSNWHFMRVR